MGKGVHAGMLGGALILVWVTLSGRYDNLLLVSLGAVSILLVVAMTDRMGGLDAEGSAYHRIPAVARYWFWLGGEIVRANLKVARVILTADLDLTPRLVRVTPRQKTDYGRTIFANSITLTPGTVTVEVDDETLLVHALMDEMADPAGFEDMNTRAAKATEGDVW